VRRRDLYGFLTRHPIGSTGRLQAETVADLIVVVVGSILAVATAGILRLCRVLEDGP
jgi:hypothetical protein